MKKQHHKQSESPQVGVQDAPKKRKRIVKRVIDAIGIVVFVFVVAVMGSVLVQTMRGQDPVLFGYRLYTVATGSMEPTIMTGDVIICENVKDPLTLEEGDIITFIAPAGFSPAAIVGRPVTHRIVKSPFQAADGVWYVVTRGDANAGEDNVPIPVSDIVGKLVSDAPALRGLMTFFSKWYGFVLMIVLPLVLVLISQIYTLVKAQAQAKAEKIERQSQLEKDRAIEQAEKIALERLRAEQEESERQDREKDGREDGAP